jgi:hypothetical protein
MLQAIGSDRSQGISNEELDLETRKQLYGTNKREVADPPGLLELFC